MFFSSLLTFFFWCRRPEHPHLYQCEEHTVVRCVLSLRIETKGAGNWVTPSIWRHSHQLATEPNMLFVMSSLILVQFLLLGLRVIETTTDTWRHCTGILPFYLNSSNFSFTCISVHFNTSDAWVNDSVNGLQFHIKKNWEMPAAKILLDNFNFCIGLLFFVFSVVCTINLN